MQQQKLEYQEIIQEYVHSLLLKNKIILNISQDADLAQKFSKSFNIVRSFVKHFQRVILNLQKKLSQNQSLVFQIFRQIILPPENDQMMERQGHGFKRRDNICCQFHQNQINEYKNIVKYIFTAYNKKKQKGQNLFLIINSLCDKILQCKNTIEEYESIFFGGNDQEKKGCKQQLDVIIKLSQFNIFPNLHQPMKFMFNKVFNMLYSFQINSNLKGCVINSFQLFKFLSLNRLSLKKITIEDVQIVQFETFLKFFRILNEEQNYCIYSDDINQLSLRIIEYEGQNHHALQSKYKKNQEWIKKLGQVNEEIHIKINTKFYHGRTPSLEAELVHRIITQKMKDLIYFSQHFQDFQHVEIISTIQNKIQQGLFKNLKYLLKSLKFKKIKLAIEDVSDKKQEFLSQDSSIHKFIEGVFQRNNIITSLKFIQVRFIKGNYYYFIAYLHRIIAKIMNNNEFRYLGSFKSNISSLLCQFFRDKQLAQNIQCEIQIKGNSDQEQVINNLLSEKSKIIQNGYACQRLNINTFKNKHLQHLINPTLYLSQTLSITKNNTYNDQFPLKQRNWLCLSKISWIDRYRKLQVLVLTNIKFLFDDLSRLLLPCLKRVCLQQCFITRKDIQILKTHRKWLICINNCHIQQSDKTVKFVKGIYCHSQEHRQTGSYQINFLLVKAKKLQIIHSQVSFQYQDYIDDIDQEQQSICRQFTYPIQASHFIDYFLTNLQDNIGFVNLSKQLQYFTKYNLQINKGGFKVTCQKGFGWELWNKSTNQKLRKKYLDWLPRLRDQLANNYIYCMDLSKMNIIVAITDRQKIKMPQNFSYSIYFLDYFAQNYLLHLNFQLIDYKYVLFLSKKNTIDSLLKLVKNKTHSFTQKIRDKFPITSLLDEILQKKLVQPEAASEHIRKRMIESYNRFFESLRD